MAESEAFLDILILAQDEYAENGALLQATIRTIGRVVYHVSHEVLMDRLPGILPGVVRAFNHANADIRKAVVFSLVDMFMVLGDRLTPILSENLSVSQLKLVTIYCNRQLAARA